MRRLFLLAATAVAAASFALPAQAGHECLTDAYGVRLGDFEAGVCAGGYCTDLCEIELSFYCHGPAPIAKYCPAAVNA